MEVLLLFSHSVVSDSMWPHGLQHTRLPCPSLSQELLKPMSTVWMMPSSHLVLCHPLLLLPSVFPSIRVFSMSQLFTSGGQSFGASASASVFLINIQGWFPLELTGLISLLSKKLSKVFCSTTIRKPQFFALTFFSVHLSHPYMTTDSTWLWLYGPLLAKWCLCFLICCLGLP